MDYSTKTNRRLLPEERVCIIRTRDGIKMEFRGDDAPSIKSTLLFFKRRKLAAIQAKRANGDKSEDPKQRMARDLNDRLAGRGGERSIQTNLSRGGDLTPWWEKIGSLQQMRGQLLMFG
jgi:hypothetical protein